MLAFDRDHARATPRESEQLSCEVLVIGSGLAGLMAALAASERGAQVMLACAGGLGVAGDSAIASGGLAVAANAAAGDSSDHHLEDTMTSGAGLVAPAIAGAVTSGGPEVLARLVDYGARFARDQTGELAFKAIPGHRYPRSVRCEGGGTRRLITPLLDALAATDTQVLDHVFVQSLQRAGGSTDGGQIVGAIGMREDTGADISVTAKAVVLATGGLGQLFPHTSNQENLFGSGYALALQAGCAVADLEFIQFTPTALVYPTFASGMSPGGALMAQPGVTLRNTDGERFMLRHDPANAECSTRDVLARAIHREVGEGRGGPHGGVFLDLTGTDRSAIADISGRFLRAMDAGGFDPFGEMVEVAPEAHFCMGGVAVTEHGESEVPGLYAVGEATCGMHGANRLNSNALTEAAVTGRTAGMAAAGYAATRPECDVTAPRVARSRDPDGSTGKADEAPSAEFVHRQVKELMARAAGVERHVDVLRDALSEVQAMAKQVDGALPRYGTKADRAFVAASQMCLVAEAVLHSALAREESRGSHFRTDHPRPRPDQCVHNLLHWSVDSGFSLERIPPGQVPRRTTEIVPHANS